MRLTPRFFDLIMAQVRPGCEIAVCEDLLEHFLVADTNFDPKIYFSFAEYDIVLILPLVNESSINLLSEFSHPDIIDLQQVFCFPWTEAENSYQINWGAALTVTLLKFDDFQDILRGLNFEKQAVKWVEDQILNNSKRPDDLLLLGNMGWPEVILIQTGPNLQNLIDNILNLVNESTSSFPFLLHSQTFPCANWDQQTVKNQEQDNKEFRIKPIEGNIEWRVLVSRRPGSSKLISDYFKDENVCSVPVAIRETFGRRDLELYPQGNVGTSVEDLIHCLNCIRSSSIAKSVISTHTQIMGKLIEQTPERKDNLQHGLTQIFLGAILSWWRTFRQYPEKPISIKYGKASFYEKIQELIEALNDFKFWESSLQNPGMSHANELRQILFRIQALLATPGYHLLAQPLINFADWAIDDALRLMESAKITPLVKVTSALRRKYNLFEGLRNVFHFGLEQRSIGTQFGIGNTSRAYTGPHGLGIQRILDASNAIPRALINSFKGIQPNEWWGFTLFGYENETATLECGIINLPYNDITRPSEWWRLGHETGHAFAMLVDLHTLQSIADLKSNLHEKARSILDITGTELIEELFANVFEYYFCFRGDFELYLTTVWIFLNRYLDGESNPKRFKEFILRFVFTYSFHLEKIGVLEPGETIDSVIEQGKKQRNLFINQNLDKALILRALREEETFDKLIKDNILDPIVKAANRLRYDLLQVPIDDVIELYRICEPLRSELGTIFELCGAPNPSIQDLNKRLSDISNRLIAGYIVEDIEEPLDTYLIPLSLQFWAIKNKKSIPVLAELSAILSLWHWERKNLYRAILDVEQIEELLDKLADKRFQRRLHIDEVSILETETYRVVIGTLGSDQPVGEMYYTTQDGWHLKDENEVMEFVRGKGWVVKK